MAEENDTLKLTSVNYTSDNYLAAKNNEDGSYNVEDKVVFEQDITTPGGEVATKSDLDGKQDNVGLFIDDDGYVSTGKGIKQYGMTSINYFEGLTQFVAGAEIGNTKINGNTEINGNTVINGQITQSGMPYENYFEGLTRFGGSVEFQGDIKIGDQHPVLNLYSSDNSVTVTRDLDGYGFDLKANGGSIDENKVITGRYETFGYGSNRFIADSKVDAIRLTENNLRTDIEIGSINLHDEDGPVNADFTVQARITSFCPTATISIPCDDGGGYTAITSNRGTQIMRFQHDTSAGAGDPNTKIYFNTPVYDKDGNEITGGGGGGSDRVTTDADGRTLILGNSSSEEYGALVIGTEDEFHQGEVNSPMIYSTGEYAALFIGGGENNFISFYRHYGNEPVICIKIGTEELVLNQAKLQKLKEWLES